MERALEQPGIRGGPTGCSVPAVSSDLASWSTWEYGRLSSFSKALVPPVDASRPPPVEDERRAVRIEAVRAILDILAIRALPTLAPSARAAIGEYQRCLAAQADNAETQLAIAGTARDTYLTRL